MSHEAQGIKGRGSKRLIGFYLERDLGWLSFFSQQHIVEHVTCN